MLESIYLLINNISEENVELLFVEKCISINKG